MVGSETVEITRQVPIIYPFSGETKVSEVKTVIKTTKPESSDRRVVIAQETFKETMRQVAYKAHKEAQNEYDKSFSTLLTILTIFGIAWPVIIALLQFKFNEKELNKIDNADKIVEDAIKYSETASNQATQAVELTQTAVNEVDNVRNNVVDLNKTTVSLNHQIASLFEGLMTICAINCRTNAEENTDSEVLNLYNFVVGFDNALNCYVTIQNAEGTMRLLKSFIHIIGKKNQQSTDVVVKVFNMLKNDAKQNSKFCSGKEIKELLGEENIELYRQYREFFIDLYPWKFDGDGE